MNKNNVICSFCLHDFFPSKVKKKHMIEFCKNCGILSVDSKPLRKPSELNSICEYDKIMMLTRIKESFADKIIHIKEKKNIDYLHNRTKILGYLKRLCQNYGYSEETLYIASSYIDRILINNKMKYDLTVIGSLLLAVKFIEKDPIIPNYAEFLNPKKECYSKEEISNSEILCLKFLNYNLSVQSCLDILNYFLNNGIVYSQDMKEISTLYSLSKEIMNCFNQDIKSVDFTPIEVTLASISWAGELTGKTLNQKIKQTFSIVYDINIDDYFNAYTVIKNLFPQIKDSQGSQNSFSSQNEKNSKTGEKHNPSITNLNKQILTGKNHSYKDLQFVNLSFYQNKSVSLNYNPNDYSTIQYMNLGMNPNLINNSNEMHLQQNTFHRFQQYQQINTVQVYPFIDQRMLPKKSNYSISHNSSKCVHHNNFEKINIMDNSWISTKDNSRKTSRGISEESYLCELSQKSNSQSSFEYPVTIINSSLKTAVSASTYLLNDISPKDKLQNIKNPKDRLISKDIKTEFEGIKKIDK